MANPRKPAAARVSQAVGRATKAAASEGKVLKVLFLDEKGDAVGEYASSQLPENPFAGQMGGGLQEPPFRLEQLVYLAEMHPVHSAALEQKTMDICGKGWTWLPRDPDNAPEDVRDEIDDWFEGLAPDDVDMRELIWSVENDVETVGWGLTEILRDPQGIAQRAYHVPGHTVRAHRDGFRLCQIRDNRKVWFRRWGAPLKNGKEVMVDAVTGGITVQKPPLHPANDMLVIRRPSRRSDFYGIPGYVSSIGWITLALAARDDNLFFFSNRREPRWAIILSNLADDPDLQEDLRRSFEVDLRQPYRNLLIPITGPGKIDFQKLTDNRLEGSFEKLSERADRAIMISHRVPGERIANAEVGPLGGNNVPESSRVYKEAVVAPGQELLNSRFNRFCEVEYAKVTGAEPEKLPWKLEMDDLDLGTEREELDLAAIAFHANMVTLREARGKIKLEPLMRPKTSEPNQPAPATPELDPVTGLPVTPEVDPVTGLPVAPVVPPGAGMGQGHDPEALNPETNDPLDEAEEEESPLNDKLFSELPGVTQGDAGKPGSPGVGTGGLAHGSRANVRDAALASLTKDMRELWDQARETHELIERSAEDEALGRKAAAASRRIES
jgi:hypothetical protein